MTDTPVIPEPDDKKVPPSKEDVKTPPAEPSGAKPDEDTRTPAEKALGIRLKEEADKRRAAEEKLQKITDEQDKIRQAELEEKGQYKELLEEEKKKREKLEAESKEKDEKLEKHAEQEKARREALLDALTEEQREIAETIGTLAHLEKYVRSVTGGAIPTDKGKPGRGGPGKYPGGFATKTEFAAKDPDGYEKWKKESRPPLSIGTVTIPPGYE